MSPEHLQKTKKLTDCIVSVLNSEIHKKDDFHYTYIKRAISNSLYDMGPKIPSGMISTKALAGLKTGINTRSQLCKEHPYPRMRTTVDIMKIFDGPQEYTQKINNIHESITKGCKVNLVLSEENQKLYPFQQDYSLSEEEIYSKAGVELVEDDLKLFSDFYIHENKKYYSIPEIANALSISKYAVTKMIERKEIEKHKRIR